MIFDLRDFEDLSTASDGKLNKLRDVATTYHNNCERELQDAKKRLREIRLETERRAQLKLKK